MNDILLRAERIHKSFILPDKSRLEILRGLSIAVPAGTMIAVTGVSGSGKSTLLHLLGSLDTPDSGEIVFAGENLRGFDTRRISRYRNGDIGFVYQFHYLMPELTVLENVAAPALLQRFHKQEAFRRAAELLAAVGLQGKEAFMPAQLAGGEKQRAAIARSLINEPRLLLADEPTGSLDWQTGERVFSVLRDLLNARGLAAVIVTHNPQLAAMCDRAFVLQNGELLELPAGAGTGTR